MKKPYSPNLSVLRRRTTMLPRYTLRIVGSFLVLGLVLLGLRILLPDALTAIARPFWSFSSGATHALGAFTESFVSKNALMQYRDRLQSENVALLERNGVLEAKAADLERLLGGREAPTQGIPAGVLARPPVAPYDMLILDAGTKEGVRVDAFVYGPGGAPLGTVESVSNGGSRVSLYTTPGRASDAWIGENRLAVTLTGRGSGAFAATVPHTAGITEGTVVYMPGPGALPIGTVVHVDSNPSSPNDELSIQSYQNLFSLTWVTVAERS